MKTVNSASIDVILYESSSTGGIFEYSRYLFQAYAKHGDVSSVTWLLPSSASVSTAPGVLKVLCNDRPNFKRKFFKRLHFVYRSFVNPYILFRYLRSARKQHFVILNDFDQLTALLWVPLYRRFLGHHRFAIALHDPDRDAYPPSKRISALSMKKIMSLMSIALYHEHLPKKSYYHPNGKTRYVSVPHGHYQALPVDRTMADSLISKAKEAPIVAIIGNIRMEKNYELAIKAVSQIGGFKLLIAGAPSSSSINVEDLRTLAASLKVEDRLMFIVKFLSPEEMNAVVETSALILLNYKNTFASYSGIFNLIAPFRKKLVVSRTESGTAVLAKRFGIGYFVEPDNLNDLIHVLQRALNDGTDGSKGWDEYLQYSSWENHVNIVVAEIKRLPSDAV
jgi:glycosyltransferase involved in cell wall biosynthesis